MIANATATTIAIVIAATSVASTGTSATNTKGAMANSARNSPPPPSSPPPSVGKMLGTVAVALGIGMLGVYMLDLHTHTCEVCGNSWRHMGAFNVGDPGSHTCVKCGTVQWWKDGVPHVFRSVLYQPPPKVMPDAMAARLGGMRDYARLAGNAAPASPVEGLLNATGWLR